MNLLLLFESWTRYTSYDWSGNPKSTPNACQKLERTCDISGKEVIKKAMAAGLRHYQCGLVSAEILPTSSS